MFLTRKDLFARHDTMNWTPENRVVRNNKAVWRAFGGEVAIIVPGSSAIRTLNLVGARIWELADGRTLAAIIDQLLNEFEVERTVLEGDARAFLLELEARNLLEPNA
jgi:GeoRSP system PqqD family protein